MKNKRILTILISTQRSGSTRFRQDLKSLVGLGDPKEYAYKLCKDIGYIRDADTLLKACRCDTSTNDVYAIKIMLNHSSAVLETFAGKRNVDLFRRRNKYASLREWKTFIQSQQEKFDSVLIFILHRNNVYQLARSRAFAQLTRTYHNSETSKKYSISQVNSSVLGVKILLNLLRAFLELNMLRKLSNELAKYCCIISFDELIREIPKAEMKVQNYLGTKQIKTKYHKFDRSSGNKQLLTDTVLLELKARKNYIIRIIEYLFKSKTKHDL